MFSDPSEGMAPPRPTEVTPAPSRAPDGGGSGLPALVPPGRLVELCGERASGRLTLAAGFVREAQARGELAAWVQPEGAGLYPPDLDAAGVSLDELVVVHAPTAAGPEAVARAAELLLRSGGFGVAVLDLCAARPRGEGWVARLGGVARRHGARVVLLTSLRAEGASAGALVAVRAAPRRRFEAGRFALDVEVLRDRCDLARRAAPTLHAPPWDRG
ncbi:MAG: hypothetical protein U0324_10685 [Polyangiales bacterium]